MAKKKTKGGKVKVQHYGNTLHDFDVKNKSEAENRINKLLNRYNKTRRKTSNYAIYFEDENGKITSWQKFEKGGKFSDFDYVNPYPNSVIGRMQKDVEDLFDFLDETFKK